MNANIEDLIAIQHLYNACVALHTYAKAVGEPKPLNEAYNDRVRHMYPFVSSGLPTYRNNVDLAGLMLDACQNSDYPEQIIGILKDVAQDLAAYIR
jgi:hypothetical protein